MDWIKHTTLINYNQMREKEKIEKKKAKMDKKKKNR